MVLLFLSTLSTLLQNQSNLLFKAIFLVKVDILLICIILELPMLCVFF